MKITTQITTNNNKPIITNETVGIRQSVFAHATFLSSSKFQMYLIFRLHILILIYELDVFL